MVDYDRFGRGLPQAGRFVNSGLRNVRPIPRTPVDRFPSKDVVKPTLTRHNGAMTNDITPGVRLIKATILYKDEDGLYRREETFIGVLPEGWTGYSPLPKEDRLVFQWIRHEEADAFGEGYVGEGGWEVEACEEAVKVYTDRGGRA